MCAAWLYVRHKALRGWPILHGWILELLLADISEQLHAQSPLNMLGYSSGLLSGFLPVRFPCPLNVTDRSDMDVQQARCLLHSWLLLNQTKGLRASG